jgi:hypothetical protein
VGGSASTSDTLIRGWLARRRASAAGTRVALEDGKEASRARPARSPAMAATSSSAVARRAETASAWAASAWPASVSRMPRPTRVTSGVPTSRSRRRMWWVMAGWV